VPFRNIESLEEPLSAQHISKLLFPLPAFRSFPRPQDFSFRGELIVIFFLALWRAAHLPFSLAAKVFSADSTQAKQKQFIIRKNICKSAIDPASKTPAFNLLQMPRKAP